MTYISTANIKASTIREVIETYADNGLTRIELSGGTNYYENIETDLIELKKQYNVEYVCHAYFPPPKEDFVVNLASCNEDIYNRSIQHYEDCVKMLSRIGCNVLSIHAGFMVEINPVQIGKQLDAKVVYNGEEAYDRFYKSYRYLSNLCANEGIKLYLENNVISEDNLRRFNGKNYMMMTDYKSIKYMMQNMDFNLLLDLAHLAVSCNALKLDYEEQCKLLAPYAKWIHMSNNDMVTDLHMPIDITSRIYKAYVEYIGKDIPVTLETKGTIEQIKMSKEKIDEIR